MRVKVAHDSSVHRVQTNAFGRFVTGSPNAEILVARILKLPFVKSAEDMFGWIELECSDMDLPRNMEILKRHLAAPIAKGESIGKSEGYNMSSSKYFNYIHYHQGEYNFHGDDHA